MNTFKFSETQMQVLKNFAAIFPSLTINPDRTEVISSSGAVIGSYEFNPPLETDLPFSVHDLNELLAILNFYKTPSNTSITVEDKWLRISDGNSEVKYFTTPPHLVPKVVVSKKYTTTDIKNKLDQCDCELDFTLSSENLSMLLKMSSLIKAKYLFFETVEDVIRVTIGESLKSSDNSWQVLIKENIRANKLISPMVFDISELKLLVLDYNIRVSALNMSEWINTFGVTYFIGCSVHKDKDNQ